LLYRLQPRVIAVDAARVNLLAQSSAVREVISLLNRADKPYVHSGGIPFKTLQQGISFDSVHFGYSNASAALRDVSFCIPQGKVTAIVGPSGAGKTTIIHLICRLYDAIDGNIYIDGVPLRELDLTSWRGRIALAGQDTYVFNTTVRENILVGRPEAASRDIQEAAIQANAHEFICSLPGGYDTKLGDRGLRLSGGQRQRIALARALLRDPEILLLDEATNALDSVSETAIQQTLKNSRPNRTIVIVAHRLSTVRNADQLVLLKNGTVVEQSHPQVLLEMNGVFAELSRLQRKS